ncbi:MAG: phosphatase PAP2 family protein [Thermaerobacter sp.]|nr:phosphatase PAP2 family protein [Thermaerobacter sp.]
MDALDRSLFFWWNGFAGRSQWLDAVAVAGAQYAIFAVAGLMLILWFALPRGDAAVRRRLLLAGLAGLVALLANYLIALVYPRERPFVIYPHRVHLLLQHAPDASFPSDHAAVAGAVAWVMWAAGPVWRVVFWLLAVIIILARVFVGVHWPTDVLGGAVVGALSGSLVLAAQGALERPLRFILRLFRYGGESSSSAFKSR